MNRTQLILVIGVLILGLGGWWYSHTHKLSTQSSSVTTLKPQNATTSKSVAIPGTNLTLGQDKDAVVGAYLIGYNGHALYTYSADEPGTSRCTGACVSVWPPYTVTSSQNLIGEYPLSGTISTIKRSDGTTQVTYDGKPLYFYSKDGDSGVTGAGVSGSWQVAKP